MTKILIDEATVKLALEALRSMANTLAEHQEPTSFYEDEAMRALKALAEQPAPVQEPEWYHFVRRGEDFFVPYEGQAPANATRLYTAPQAQPARDFVWLTLEEIKELKNLPGANRERTATEMAFAVRNKLMEKNT